MFLCGNPPGKQSTLVERVSTTIQMSPLALSPFLASFPHSQARPFPHLLLPKMLPSDVTLSQRLLVHGLACPIWFGWSRCSLVIRRDENFAMSLAIEFFI